MTADAISSSVTAGHPASRPGGPLLGVLRSMRPRQWTKNGVVMVGVVFARELDQPDQVLRAALATIIFCLLSGAVYLANDLVDMARDQLHPTKRFRPLASGELSPRIAVAVTGLIVSLSLIGAFLISPGFCVVATSYVLIQALYAVAFKNTVILDVLILASGFVLRAVAGAVAVNVPISPWLYVCTMLLALFLALGKRRQELILMSASAAAHRPTLSDYTVGLLDILSQVVTTSLLVSYMLYTFFAENVPRNSSMMLTIPFVLYGLFRYLYLVHARGEGGAPEEVLLRDRPMAACVLLWALACALVLYVLPRG